MTSPVNKPPKTIQSQSDPIAFIAEILGSKVPAINLKMQNDITAALHELLNGRDPLARKLRTEMQHYFVHVVESLIVTEVAGACVTEGAASSGA